MEASGDLVSLIAEFSSCMESGHDHFYGRFPGSRDFVHRDASPVVNDRHRVVMVNNDLDVVAHPGKGFIYTVVYDFKNQVVKSFRAGTADIHGRPDPDRLKPLEHLDIFCIVMNFPILHHRRYWI